MRTSVFLTSIAVLLAVSLSANAYDFQSNGIYFNILSEENLTMEVISQNSSDKYKGAVEIPSKVIYNSKTYNVTSIGRSAFDGCSGLTSVAIPSSVTYIYEYAFDGCSGLTSVEIPSSVTYIGVAAFRGCSGLTSVEIPSSVTYIGGYAFDGCSSLTRVKIPSSVTYIRRSVFSGCSSLTSVEIPSSVTSIGDYAFNGCSSLTSVAIPSSVTSLWSSAFNGCSSLAEFNVSVDNMNYSSIDGVLYNKYVSELICYPNGKKSELFEIPSSVTSIGDLAFNGCSSLTRVAIPSSVTSIGDYAFSDCSGLTSVEIPLSVTSIGYYAFNGCSVLKAIYCKGIPPKCNNAFENQVLMNAVLYVPVGAKSEYEKADSWRNFRNIQEMDYSGIESVKKDDDIEVSVDGDSITVGGDIPVEVYSMSGQCVYRGCDRRIENLAPGIYVVRVGGKSIKAVISR